MLNSLIQDLEQEISYAVTTSPLYGAMFSTLRDAISDPSFRNFQMGLEEVWKDKVVTAWFERPLLLGAALHRLVRSGAAPELAAFYRTMDGNYQDDQLPQLTAAIHHVLRTQLEEFFAFLKVQTLQTNEISRGITWLYALSSRWHETRSQIGLFEIGCSSGLNLIADQYGLEIETPNGKFNKPGTPMVHYKLQNEGTHSETAVLDALKEMSTAITIRLGCDLNVPDVRKESDRAMLEAMIWGDNPMRLQRLQNAIIAQTPILSQGQLQMATSDAICYVQEAALKLAQHLQPGDIACFFNTVVTCYFSEEDYQKLRAEIENAFATTLQHQRCLWIEHEPQRKNENLSESENRFDALVRISELDHDKKLKSVKVIGTEMHPIKLVWLA